MTEQAQQSSELQAVLQHQEATAAAQATVTKLQQAIAAQQEKADLLLAKVESVTALETQREDLLADIATGNDKAAELKALDTRLAQHRKDVSERGSQAVIGQTVAGLTRKLERALGELQALQAQRPTLLRKLLLAQAEALGGEYVAAARELKRVYRRLEGMGHLLQAFGQVPAIFIGAGGGLGVPAFNLESVRPHVDFVNPNMLINRPHDSRYLSGLIQYEKAALQELGVDFSDSVVDGA